MKKTQYKKYYFHSKELSLGDNFDAMYDLDYTVFENVENSNRGFICDLFVPHLKTHSAYFNLGYLSVLRFPKDVDVSNEMMKSLNINEHDLEYFFDFHYKPYIDMIRIFEPYRNKGIAEQLILHAAEYYMAQGLTFCFSNINSDEMLNLKNKMIEKYDFISAIYPEISKNYNQKIRHGFYIN